MYENSLIRPNQQQQWSNKYHSACHLERSTARVHMSHRVVRDTGQPVCTGNYRNVMKHPIVFRQQEKPKEFRPAA